MASKINEYIYNFFNIKDTNISYYDVQYDKNNCFNLFINRIKLDEDTYLIPAVTYYGNHVNDFPNMLYKESRVRDKLSETTLLRDLGYFRSIKHSIKHLRTKANEIYYGCPGVALDSNFNILMLIVFKVNKEGEILDTYCFINPSVFINDKRTLEKSIIKKIIPTISIESSYCYYKRRNITFVFKNVTKDFIYIPKAPDNNFNDSVANDFLEQKIDSILEDLETNFIDE